MVLPWAMAEEPIVDITVVQTNRGRPVPMAKLPAIWENNKTVGLAAAMMAPEEIPPEPVPDEETVSDVYNDVYQGMK